MLSDFDKIEIETIVEKVVDKRVNRVEDKIDKVLKIVTRIDHEHTLTQARVNKHEKRLVKIEKKIHLKSPSESVVFA